MDEVKAQELYDHAKAVAKSVEPPLSEDAIELAGVAMSKQTWMVLLGEQNAPGAMFVKQGKLGIMLTEFPDELGSKPKDAFAAMIRNLRRDCDAVAFVSEMWMAKYRDKKKADFKSGDYVRPTDHPDRQECCMVILYVGNRKLMFIAFIHRNPTRVDDWILHLDSAKEDQGIEGRFA